MPAILRRHRGSVAPIRRSRNAKFQARDFVF